jgi:hypothetical protein
MFGVVAFVDATGRSESDLFVDEEVRSVETQFDIVDNANHTI